MEAVGNRIHGNMVDGEAVAAYFDYGNTPVDYGGTNGEEYLGPNPWDDGSSASAVRPNTSWDIRNNPDYQADGTIGRADNSAWHTHMGGKILLTVDDENTTPTGTTPGWDDAPRKYRFAILTPSRLDGLQQSHFYSRLWGTFKIERICDVNGNPGLNF